MTWSEWIRAMLHYERSRKHTLRDFKVLAYYVAALTHPVGRRLPSLQSWLMDRQARPVTGREKQQLQNDRKFIEHDLGDLLAQRRAQAKKAAARKGPHGGQRSTR